MLQIITNNKYKSFFDILNSSDFTSYFVQGVKEENGSSKMSPQNIMVCKSAPYNICYKLDQKAGKLIPLSRRIKPVRILRVY